MLDVPFGLSLLVWFLLRLLEFASSKIFLPSIDSLDCIIFAPYSWLKSYRCTLTRSSLRLSKLFLAQFSLIVIGFCLDDWLTYFIDVSPYLWDDSFNMLTLLGIKNMLCLLLYYFFYPSRLVLLLVTTDSRCGSIILVSLPSWLASLVLFIEMFLNFWILSAESCLILFIMSVDSTFEEV